MVNEKKRTPKFKRTDFSKYSKLGVRRKNKQVYRRPKGIDNKINKKMKGHLRRVMIGFKNESKSRGLIDGMEPVMVFNVEGLLKVAKGEIAIVAKVGMKKKAEIAKVALEKKIRLYNLNSKKFLDNLKKVEKEKEEKKAKMNKKKKAKDKKAKEVEKKEAEEKETPEGVPSEGKEGKDDKESVDDKVEEKPKKEGKDKKKEEAKDKSEKKKTTKKNTEEVLKTPAGVSSEGKNDIKTNNYGRGK
ncbi:hypothetical protein HOE04_04700 [archaeon]|jgi:ribosomal protein L32E|nr:hypothetical protein [archaeon]